MSVYVVCYVYVFVVLSIVLLLLYCIVLYYWLGVYSLSYCTFLLLLYCTIGLGFGVGVLCGRGSFQPVFRLLRCHPPARGTWGWQTRVHAYNNDNNSDNQNNDNNNNSNNNKNNSNNNNNLVRNRDPGTFSTKISSTEMGAQTRVLRQVCMYLI